MVRQAVGAPPHRAIDGKVARSHGPGHIVAYAGWSLPPVPGTWRCRRKYRCAGSAGSRWGGQMMAHISRGWAPLAARR